MRRRAHELDRCHGRLIASLLCVLARRFGLVALRTNRLQVVVPVHLVAPPLAARALCLAYDVIHLSGQRDMAGLVARLAQSSVASHHPRPELAPRCAITSLSVRAPGVVFAPPARLTLVGVAVTMRGARQRCAPAMQTWTVGALWHAAPSIRRPFGLPRGRGAPLSVNQLARDSSRGRAPRNQAAHAWASAGYWGG